MKLDKNEFFRQATLRICSSLDIEKAMLNCLSYIQAFVPVSELWISLWEPKAGLFRNLAWVTAAGSKKPFPPISVPREIIRQMESDDLPLKQIKIYNDFGQGAIEKVLFPYLDLSNVSFLGVMLVVEGKPLGSLSLITESKGRFTEAHADLISLLREPFSIALSNALRYEELEKLKDMVDAENRELNRELHHVSADDIVGVDWGLKNVMEMVRQVAPLASPVLLLGETGVGKEVIANVIHYSSARRNAPFVKVNCGAIPENLLDSELFGHERGAFTGAVVQTKGRFERADKGTIFLDEIGELPLQAQVKLLRVLQNKEIERVGGTKTIPVDVRVIAATHQNMEEMVRTGKFREDIWYRLNVFPITIPPLRHRKEDIPALVQYFLEKKSKQLKFYPPPAVSPEGMERLTSYAWPGNVRELENLVEREFIRIRTSKGKKPLLFDNFDFPASDNESESALPEDAGALPTLDAAISRHIRRALRLTGGRIFGPNGAADLLGINPNTLRARMRKLGIRFEKRAVVRPMGQLGRPNPDNS